MDDAAVKVHLALRDEQGFILLNFKLSVDAECWHFLNNNTKGASE